MDRARWIAVITALLAVTVALSALLHPFDDSRGKRAAAAPTVSPANVRRYYLDHLDQYRLPASRTIRRILVPQRATAARLYSSIRRGSSFAALARRFSRDPASRALGGRLVVTRSTEPPLGLLALSLSRGATSHPFRTMYGYSIIRPTSPIRPPRVVPLAHVRSMIQHLLLRQDREKRGGGR